MGEVEFQPKNVEHKGQEITPEKGANVQIVLKFMRHGEKAPSGELTEYGREVTRSRAQESGIKKKDFNVLKAYGSNAAPINKGSKMGRALETANIYVEKISKDNKHVSRRRDILSHESIVNKLPYDHQKIYNEQLPANFDELSDEEKAAASRKAQDYCTNYGLNLNTPENIAYKKEVAGSFAKVITHFEELAKRLKPNSKVLAPQGTHGGPYMELILKEALVREFADGRKIEGFADIVEIGGAFDPSESFNVFVETDEKGWLKSLKVTFEA